VPLSEGWLPSGHDARVARHVDVVTDRPGVVGDLAGESGTDHLVVNAIHADYVQDQQAQHAPPGATQVPWELLSNGIRGDNVRAAADVEYKLDVIGADLMPLGPDLGSFTFTSTEIEMLAMREHDRWMAAKVADGFRWGPQRTMATHPDLRPWADLDDSTQRKDIRMITNLPVVLADAVGISRQCSPHAWAWTGRRRYRERASSR
jgi:hypothetical protein